MTGTTSLGGCEVELQGESQYDGAGNVVIGVGDVDGDGLDDLLVGASGQDSGGTSAGAAYIVPGPVIGTVELKNALVRITGETEMAGFPDAGISGLGDANDDGVNDLLLPSYGVDFGGDAAGAAYLLLGPISAETTLADSAARLIGEEADDYAGIDSCWAGDTDGDGTDDLVVAAYGNDEGGTSAGAVYLVLGTRRGDVDLGAADAKWIGEYENDHAGRGVAGPGDVNDDGYADVLIGAPYESSTTTNGGTAYLVQGPFTGATSLGGASVSFHGNVAGGIAGHAVAGPGDVDGDGHPDLLIGAYYDSDAAIGAGAAYLHHGPFAGAIDLDSADAKLLGEKENDLAGHPVAGAGDVDGDGKADLLIGAYSDDTSGDQAGAVYLVLGRGL